jgi:PIN like domain
MITARRRKRSRKGSGASSIAAKRLSSTVFYLDESIYSPRLAEGMRQAGASIVTPFDAGLAGSTDEVWLSAIGEKRWLALMRDQNIRRRVLERRALVAAGVGAFVCTAGEATAVEITATVVALLRKIVNVAISEPRPFIFTFGLGGRLRQVPRRALA